MFSQNKIPTNFIFSINHLIDIFCWIERKETSNKCTIRKFIYKYTVIQQPSSTQCVEEKVIVTFFKWEEKGEIFPFNGFHRILRHHH